MSEPENESAESKSNNDLPIKTRVVHTRKRGHKREYIVQVRRELIDELYSNVDFEDSGFLIVRNTDLPANPEIHVRYQDIDQENIQSVNIGTDEIGLDFTLRYALGIPAEADTGLGASGETNTDPDNRDSAETGTNCSSANRVETVELEPVRNREEIWLRRKLNKIIGARPQVCRVRMGVLPDLEDKVCRLPENTMQLIGIEEGDYICIESSDDIVRGVKAFAIDSDIEEKKQMQKEEQSEHYIDCWKELKLERLRKPKVDIPEIYLDSETRKDLDLGGRGKNGSNGTCQPVRVYRDSVGVLTKSAYEIVIPIALVFIAQGVGITGRQQYLWFGTALLLIFMGYLIRSRSMLGDYVLGIVLKYYN
ncbi:hypothetical protein [Natrinema salinisoli]|uniref:hypothetical protein n=1 Tax=Natrinema salinisoli TaxID=2878535 RepID=UPI001CEFC193|nr:hypothetical protein [Natrinema salinisoli]